MLTANCVNGTADGVLWEGDIEGNCCVAMEGLTVTGSDVFVTFVYSSTQL